MKNLLSILFSLLLVVTLVGCDSDDDGGDDPAATAQVRFVHASPNAGPVNVLVDGEEVASDFAFRGSSTNPFPNVSPYVEVPIDVDADIEVQTADGSSVFTVNADQVNLEENVRYTVLAAGAVGVGGGPEPILLEDRFQNLSSGQIGLRLVHGSKGVQSQVGPVDVYLTPPNTDLSQETPLISDFEFGEDSSPNPDRPGLFIPRELSGGAQVVSVTPAGSSEAALRVQIGGDGGLQVQAGQFITGIAADIPDPDGGVQAGALVIAESAPGN
jgi:hypothetical protein